MLFNTLKDKFKVKSGKKYLKEELNNLQGLNTSNKGIQTIGCIVDLDSFDHTDVFYELLEEFSLAPNAIKIIGYKSYYDKNSPYATPIFSDKDLGWKGDIENSYALEFLTREYDLLINYYTSENLLMQLMTIKTKARIRVGFGEVDKVYNDLILNVPYKDFSLFKQELSKYLKVLNEIK